MKHASLSLLPGLARVFGFAALLGTACGSDFDPSSRITTLRVLAVKADVSYAHPGETVHLDVLADDPAARKITYGYSYCVNPELSTPQGCIAQLESDAQKSGSLPPFSVTTDATYAIDVPANYLDQLSDAEKQNAQLGVIVVACPGTLRPGTSADAPYTCIDAAGNVLGLHDAIAGMKRIFVRSKDRNANPLIGKVTWDDVDWPEAEVKTVAACDVDTNTFDDCDAEKHGIAAVAADGTVETGTDEFGTSFEEQVVVQYYATEGLFENAVRIVSKPTSQFVARKSSRGKVLTVIAVMRDDRGGMSWVTRKIAVK